MSDAARYCYSAACTWHGPIDSVGLTDPEAVKIPGLPTGHRLPCCPHCGSVLFEIESAAKWEKSVAKAEEAGAVNYVAFIEWLRDCGRCFETYENALPVFAKKTGLQATLGADSE